MHLSADTLMSYNESRFITNKNIVCHAPFVNLNFEQNGNVRACCYNTTHILGKWPEQTIKQIWQGRKIAELKKYVLENDLGGGCAECGKMIASGNHQGVRAKYYDEFGFVSATEKVKRFLTADSAKYVYPKVMEFEISNTCNLECVMCNGNFSSSIRRNREKLPPIISPYNESFVDELNEFIPHLTDAKFLGGEPFMIDLYLLIWERMLKLNPKIRIHITTNGTFLNNRIKELLEGLQVGIIVSVDSFDKATYDTIRINGNFEKVMEHLNYFIDYSKRKKTFVSVAACPITYNWKELPAMLEFCLSKNIILYLNAVFSPAKLSLKEQPNSYLEEVINHLEQYQLPKNTGWALSPFNLSVNSYRDFLNLLKGWLQEKKNKVEEEEKSYAQINNVVAELMNADRTTETISKTIQAIDKIYGNEFYREQLQKLQGILEKQLIGASADELASTLSCYFIFSEKTVSETLQQKLVVIASLLNEYPMRNKILGQIAQSPPAVIAKEFIERETAQMQSDLQKEF
jgi:MoaA/NifB/PqqE/SkfB family radical SAM enzyme